MNCPLPLGHMRLLTSLFYKPIGIICGILAGLLSKRLFDFAWSRIDDREPPGATTQNAELGKVVGAAALQGAVFKGTRAVVDRYGAKGFHHVTGIWPGEKEAERV